MDSAKQPGGKQARKQMRSLEASIKKLSISRNANSEKAELISELGAVRTQFADEKRRVQKAAWVAETQPEVVKLAKFWENNASKLLPVHLWKRILGQVEDLKEKAMLSDLSMIWRDALEEDRFVFHFHEVFPLVNRNGYLRKEDILICRGVCREWNRSIEYWMQIPLRVPSVSLLEVYRLQKVKVTNPYQISLSFEVDFFTISNFIQFTRERYLDNENPFLSRRLRFGCHCPHDLQSNNFFWNHVELFLQLWGREIWTLELSFPQPQTLNSAEVYELVGRLLRLTPNLKLLSISSKGPMEDSFMLKTYIRELPLPDLPQLNGLIASYIAPAMLKAMLNKFGPTLRFMFVHGLHSNQNAYGGTRLPRLKKLALMSLRLFMADEFRFQVHWPSIEDLDLHYKNFLPEGLPQLFHVLNNFGRKLRTLNVKLEQMLGHGESIKLSVVETNQLMLELPILESFSLAMAFGKGANPKTIDFILPMVSLKYLTLYYVSSFKFRCSNWNNCEDKKVPKAGPSNSTRAKADADTDKSSEEIIQFWKYAGRLYESNIWRLLPELRTVTIFTVKRLQYCNEEEMEADRSGNIVKKVYTREGYRQYVRSIDQNGAVVADAANSEDILK